MGQIAWLLIPTDPRFSRFRSDTLLWLVTLFVARAGYDNATNFDRNKEGAYFLPAPTPVAFLADKQVCQVVAGWGHSAVLSRDGRVFICGRNFQGQLGASNLTR